MRSPSYRTRCVLLVVFALSAAVASCGSDAPTAATGLQGTYFLRSIDGKSVPFDASSNCGGPCTLASGSLEVLANDTVFIRQTTTTPPSGGLPGTAGIAIGHYILRRVGDRFAMLPGPDIGFGKAVDTLTVHGDTLVIRATPPVAFYTVRTYTR
ncbi:MAG: hypothetical protein JWL61_4282 [Gemmatimonadetes bacterium]|nr:hypothetical protein [Gemmatimonadota bacterium]